MEQMTCDHCGRKMKAADIGKMYSIMVDSQGRSVEIVCGLRNDALHYCCDNCMFDRNKGMISPFTH